MPFSSGRFWVCICLLTWKSVKEIGKYVRSGNIVLGTMQILLAKLVFISV